MVLQKIINLQMALTWKYFKTYGGEDELKLITLNFHVKLRRR